MAVIVRDDLKAIAKQRIREAKVLLDAGHYAGAYHLLGIAVECALKACIAKGTVRYEFYDKDKAKEAYDHSAKKLVNVASLTAELQKANKNALFAINWSIVAKWTVDSRYTVKTTEADARAMYKAITSRKNGVMQWIRSHW